MNLVKITISIILCLNLCQASDCVNSYKSPINHVFNGDFELGNIGFESGMIYSEEVNIDNRYYIASSPETYFRDFKPCRDQINEDGLFMIINGAKWRHLIWQQEVTGLDQNSIYVLSFDYLYVEPQFKAIPELEVYINDLPIGHPPLIFKQDSCYWNTFSFEINTLLRENLKISIYNNQTEAFGNDFSIDNIRLSKKCLLDVESLPLLPLEVCVNENAFVDVEIKNGFPPYTALWYNSIGELVSNDLNFNKEINNAGKYILTITDSISCTYCDSIIITPFIFSDRIIQSNLPNEKICPCQSVELIAPNNYNYRWLNNQAPTQKQIVIGPGVYQVELTHPYLFCKDTLSIDIPSFEAEIALEIPQIEAEIGDKVTFYIVIDFGKEIAECLSNFVFFTLDYNETILTPISIKNAEIYSDIPSKITLTVPRNVFVNKVDKHIIDLEFIVTLGNSQCSEISLIDINYNGTCANITGRAENGKLCVSDICFEPNGRFFGDLGFSSSLIIEPNIIYQNTLNYSYKSLINNEYEFKIFNLLGEKVYEEKLIAKQGINSNSIRINHYNTGIYTMVITQDFKSTIQKFIIAR